MFYPKDTICAISTAPGNAAIGIIRVSGANAIKIVSEIFEGKRKLIDIPSHTIAYGKIKDKNKVVDEVLVSVFKAPHSYTGEDLVEISCHGSNFITSKILQLLLKKCRLAEPGEFTKKAFLNDKMDLTQAEAVGDLLMAKTEFSHLAAIEQLEGNLTKKIKKILSQLTDFRIKAELEIDFSEQEIPDLNINDYKEDLIKFKNKMQQLLKNSRDGLILKEGLKISLVGAPNVGKSSIFNKFLKTERAIVTPIPGTTRDYLEEAISLNGYLLRIFDTAGLRTTDDQVEKLGIERSYKIIKNSDLIVFITDNPKRDAEDLQKLYKKVGKDRIIKVLNKIDLFKPNQLQQFFDFIQVSTVISNGLTPLKKEILKKINIDSKMIEEGILTNIRQISALSNAINSIDKAIDAIEHDFGFEFIAFDLKEASSFIEEILGKITSEDILNSIFSNFCIGK